MADNTKSTASDLYAPSDYIYIVCKQGVYIKRLRMSGPIIAPLRVKMSVAYQIVCSGVKLYQFNPATGEFALMTVANAFRKDKFKFYVPSTADATTAKNYAVADTKSQAVEETVVEEKAETPEVEETKTEETSTESEESTEDASNETPVEEVKTETTTPQYSKKKNRNK